MKVIQKLESLLAAVEFVEVVVLKKMKYTSTYLKVSLYIYILITNVSIMNGIESKEENTDSIPYANFSLSKCGIYTKFYRNNTKFDVKFRNMARKWLKFGPACSFN